MTMQAPISVLITGANGQLGQTLIATASPDIQVIAFSREKLDITDYSAVIGRITEIRPHWVINTAAYIAVDQAEREPNVAFAINGDGPGYLAQAVEKVGGRLLHISTDFVFDGKSSQPYRPEDYSNPLNVYGESKRLGEKRVLAILGERGLIVRTAWLYSAGYTNNFLSTMLRLMRERDKVQVVADQVGTPTATYTLAQALWQCIEAELGGIYHFTDAGVASWYDFAVAIQKYACQLKLLDRVVTVQPISTLEFPTLAQRPAYSVLDKSLTWKKLKVISIHWQESLYNVLDAFQGQKLR